jgi:hypothetical protein
MLTFKEYDVNLLVGILVESVAFTWKWKTPVSPGVPLILPALLMVTPAGSAPLTRAYV